MSYNIERDLSFPMQIGFTASLSQEILARELATQQIEQLEAFYVWVWNPGSKTIVVSMWQEYSSHLPHENFEAQKPFLQKLADQFKTPLPKRMIDRKLLEVIREEYFRLHNDCSIANIGQIDEHVDKLSSIIRFLERGRRGGPEGVPGPALQHYNCRSTIVQFPEPSSFAQEIIERTTRRIAESIGSRMEREFRERVYGVDPGAESQRIESIPTTLTAETIRHAIEVMTRDLGVTKKDKRFHDCEHLQKMCPEMTLGELDQALKERGHEPSLDHEESKVMPGMSKGVAGYIMLNDKLKKLMDGWCDLNTWKPNA